MLLSLLPGQKVLLSLTIRTALLPFAIATQCYFTDGSPGLAELQPCFPDNTNSACCAINKTNGDPNDICLSNGLCLAQVAPYTGLILLNGCTDRNWESSGCPGICPKSIQGSYGIHVLPCPEISNDHWCCSANGSNCCDNAFKLQMGKLMLSNTSAAPFSTATSTVAAYTGAAATTTTTTTTVIITEPTTSRAASGGLERSDSKPLVVGVSTGVGLGVCLVTLIGALWLQRRRYERRLKENQHFGVKCMLSGRMRGPPAAASAVELPLNQAPTVFEMGTGR